MALLHTGRILIQSERSLGFAGAAVMQEDRARRVPMRAGLFHEMVRSHLATVTAAGQSCRCAVPGGMPGREDWMKRRWVLIGGAGLGATVMYLLDPDRGRRRRAMLRDKAIHGIRSTGDALGVFSRNVAHRSHGLFARSRSVFARERAPDPILAERVRSRIGHVLPHAGSIDVAVREGRVILSGPIPGRDVRKLLACVSRVPGVTGIENELEAYEEGASGS